MTSILDSLPVAMGLKDIDIYRDISECPPRADICGFREMYEFCFGILIYRDISLYKTLHISRHVTIHKKHIAHVRFHGEHVDAPHSEA